MMAVAPPRPNMPPLNALRAFEAAARLNSFTAAADALFVTPAAVAQHIKLLEAGIGAELFKRKARGVVLTPLGSSVLSDFESAFDQLGMAVQKLRNTAAPNEVHIATLPSIAQLWLSPRLPEIRREMPEVMISVTALENPPNLIRDPYDLAIFPVGSDTSGHFLKLANDVIYPVCSPDLGRDIVTLSDLSNAVHLHDTTWKDDWATWLGDVMPGRNLVKSGPEFSLYSLAVEECRNGAGVLIGHDLLVRRLIENGELVAPFSERVTLKTCLAIESREELVAGQMLHTLATRLAAPDC